MDWTNILIDAGLPIPIEKSEVSIVCPLHDDRVSSLSINTDKGVWICFAGCGQGPLKSFLSKYWHISLLEVEKYSCVFDNLNKTTVHGCPSVTQQASTIRPH